MLPHEGESSPGEEVSDDRHSATKHTAVWPHTIGTELVVPGRVEIDNVQPVVSCGAYPAKAVVGEMVPVSAAVWREGHEAVAATLVVRYLGPRYPQVTETRRIKAVQAPERLASVPEARVAERVKPLLLPMTMGEEPYVFHGQFTPDRVGLWTFRVDGWGDPIHTWRHGLIAKLDAGQGETELSNDLLVGAALFERAATGVPRAARDPLLAAAAALRTPGDPVTRTALALAPELDALLTEYPLRDIVTRGEQFGVWVDRPLARFGCVVRDVSALDRWVGRRRQAGARHLRHGGRRSSAHRRDGVRRRVPAADPSDRQSTPQGPQQLSHRRSRRCGISVGDRQR